MIESFQDARLDSPFEAPVLFAPEVGSTMDVAKELIARGDAEHGTVIWVNHQTAGRGRLADRRWEESGGGALLFTLLLDTNVLSAEGTKALSLRIGVVVAEAVDHYLPGSATCEVKWPNDLLYDGRKLSGILINRGRRWTQIGIGVNIRNGAVPETLSSQAVAIEEAAGSPSSDLPTAESLLLSLLTGIRNELAERGVTGESWHHRLSRRLAFRGERVRCDSAAFPVPVTGIVTGVSHEGALLLSEIETETTPSRQIVFPEPWTCFDGEVTPL